MEDVRRVIRVDAPVKEVFDYLQNPQHLIDIWPDTLEIDVIERSPILGSRFRWVHQLANIRFEGWGECVHSIPEKRISYATTGGMACMMTWLLEADKDGTKVALCLSYEAHAPWRRDDWRSLVQHQREEDGAAMLHALKDQMEARRRETRRDSEVGPSHSLVLTP